MDDSRNLGFHLISNEEMAEIGRVITSFSVLEHEILRATIALNSETKDPDFSERFLKIVKGGFRDRIKSFCSEYRKLIGKDDFIQRFEKNLAHACNMRDHFAHGIWDKRRDGKLECQFFSRDAIRSSRASKVMIFEIEDLVNISNYNMEITVTIMHKFKSL